MSRDGAEWSVLIAESFHALLARHPRASVLAVDIPIGLPEAGPRACDREARRMLGRPRGSSIFPAPVRSVLACGTYREACARHRSADGRALSRQAFNILPKIREVDSAVRRDPRLHERVFEVHPELSFAAWNGGRPMRHNKTTPQGRRERERLIATRWPGQRGALARALGRGGWSPDDLNDALAVLWTAERIARGVAIRVPQEPESDAEGLGMAIRA